MGRRSRGPPWRRAGRRSTRSTSIPVPDGDTGTNLYLTLDAALDAVRTEHERAGILGAATPRAGVRAPWRGRCC